LTDLTRDQFADRIDGALARLAWLVAERDGGVFRAVGRKFGRWHDVSWWHLSLRAEPPHD
jgi:hypothetical protein